MPMVLMTLSPTRNHGHTTSSDPGAPVEAGPRPPSRRARQGTEFLVEWCLIQLLVQPAEACPGNLRPVDHPLGRVAVAEVPADHVAADQVAAEQRGAGLVGGNDVPAAVDDHRRIRQVGLQQPVDRGPERREVRSAQVRLGIGGREAGGVEQLVLLA
jgi:hypothetical protein